MTQSLAQDTKTCLIFHCDMYRVRIWNSPAKDAISPARAGLGQAGAGTWSKMEIAEGKKKWKVMHWSEKEGARRYGIHCHYCGVSAKCFSALIADNICAWS